MQCPFLEAIYLLYFLQFLPAVCCVETSEKFFQRPELAGKVCSASDIAFTETSPTKITCTDFCSKSSTCKCVSYSPADLKCTGCTGIYTASSNLNNSTGNIFFESEYHKDECASSPCQNGATCMDEVNAYTCTCGGGWTGVNCESGLNECDPSPCQNGATCVDGVNQYACTCTGGWTGSDCDQDINECDPNPCQNGATCINGQNLYTCTCTGGWTGTDCDQDINECDPNPCQNGATCVNGPNMYTCTCVAGMTGPDCDQDINECDPYPCQNGGSCTNGQNQYTCTCTSGWTGTDCDQDINECDPNPCQNGASCVNGQYQYTCSCTSGWTGTDCDQDINECDPNPCRNGGSCINGQSQYTCTCTGGWTGTDCDQDINECDPNPCQNGASCVNGQNQYTCSCTSGWTGTDCDQDINECDPNPCKNGATCVDGQNEYTCSCAGTWSGTLCDQQGRNHLGTRFVTGFLFAGTDNNGIPELLIIPTDTSTTTNVYITIPTLSILNDHYALNEHLILKYSNSLVVVSSAIVTSKGVEVTSDKPISVFSAVRFKHVAGDGTVELPTTVLGQWYIIDTHSSMANGVGDLLVIGTEDLTDITLSFPWGATATFMLNDLDTYRYSASSSQTLAGTVITANKPITVHAGHSCANIPSSAVSYCDVLSATVPPVESLGKTFVVPSQYPRSMYSIGVAAPYDATSVSIWDDAGTLVETVQLNEGGSFFRSYYISQVVSVTATQNILLSQYSHGYTDSNVGDPSLMYIPAISQFGKEFYFAYPTDYPNDGILIIVTSAGTSFAGFRLNLSSVSSIASACTFVSGEGDFCVYYVSVSSDVAYTLTNIDPSVVFGAMVCAYADDEQYMTALGYNL